MGEAEPVPTIHSRIDHSYTCGETCEQCTSTLTSKQLLEDYNKLLRENEMIINDNEKMKEECDKLHEKLKSLESRISELEQAVEAAKSSQFVSIDKIKHSPQLIKMYMGLENYNVYIYNRIRDKTPFIQYYKGPESHRVKSYQQRKTTKPGPKRRLSIEDELLLTLMKLKLSLNEDFLGHLFGISTSLVSSIWSTFLPLLHYELQPLIHWPEREQLKHYYPDCFKKYKNVSAIIDCTEIPIQRPSLARANS